MLILLLLEEAQTMLLKSCSGNSHAVSHECEYMTQWMHLRIVRGSRKWVWFSRIISAFYSQLLLYPLGDLQWLISLSECLQWLRIVFKSPLFNSVADHFLWKTYKIIFLKLFSLSVFKVTINFSGTQTEVKCHYIYSI